MDEPTLVLANGARRLAVRCQRFECPTPKEGLPTHLCPFYSNVGDEMDPGNSCQCCWRCTKECLEDKDDR